MKYPRTEIILKFVLLHFSIIQNIGIVFKLLLFKMMHICVKFYLVLCFICGRTSSSLVCLLPELLSLLKKIIDFSQGIGELLQ